MHDRLTECGWRDELKDQCRQLVTQRGHETTSKLVAELAERGREAVPESLKTELVAALKQALKQAAQ